PRQKKHVIPRLVPRPLGGVAGFWRFRKLRRRPAARRCTRPARVVLARIGSGRTRNLPANPAPAPGTRQGRISAPLGQRTTGISRGIRYDFSRAERCGRVRRHVKLDRRNGPAKPKAGAWQIVAHSGGSAYLEGGCQVLWEDDERVFRRGWRLDDNGKRRAVLIVLPAAEHPSRASLDRLTHEYELRDELDGSWAARPLQLVPQPARPLLLLDPR